MGNPQHMIDGFTKVDFMKRFCFFDQLSLTEHIDELETRRFAD